MHIEKGNIKDSEAVNKPTKHLAKQTDTRTRRPTKTSPIASMYGFPVLSLRHRVSFPNFDGNLVVGDSAKVKFGDTAEEALVNLHGSGNRDVADIVRRLYRSSQKARGRFGSDPVGPGEHLGYNYSIFDVDQPPKGSVPVTNTGQLTVNVSPKITRAFATRNRNTITINPKTPMDVLLEEIKHKLTAGPFRETILNINERPGDTIKDIAKSLHTWYKSHGAKAASTQSIFPNLPSRDLAIRLKSIVTQYPNSARSPADLATAADILYNKLDRAALSYYNDAAEYASLANNVKYWLAEGGVYAPKLTFNGTSGDDEDVITQLLRKGIIRKDRKTNQYHVNNTKLKAFQTNKRRLNPKGVIDFTKGNLNLQNFIDLINYRQYLKYKPNRTQVEDKVLKHAEQTLTNGYDMASNRTQKTAPTGGLRSWYSSTYPGTATATV